MHAWKSQGTSEDLQGDFKAIFKAISGPIPIISRLYASYQSRVSMDVSFGFTISHWMPLTVGENLVNAWKRRHIPKATDYTIYVYPKRKSAYIHIHAQREFPTTL
jgi:hypothetical protein